MDYTHGCERAGCRNVFAAVSEARPKVHCFGHIHEGWAARLVTWKDDRNSQPTHFTAINHEKSRVIENLAKLLPIRFDSEEDLERKEKEVGNHKQDRCCITSHCSGDEYPIEHGEQTLFVNASVCDSEGELVQLPWVVDLELPTAQPNIVS